MRRSGMPMRPGPDEIYGPRRGRPGRSPRLPEQTTEKVSKELVRGGYLREGPAAALAAGVLTGVGARARRPQPQGHRPAAPKE